MIHPTRTAFAARSGAAISRWQVLKIKFTRRSVPKDPLRELALHVNAVRPDGSSLQLAGFWDGGATWRARIMPDQPGTWRYTARFSDGVNAGSGNFECHESDLPGTVTKFAANPCWFACRSQGPILLRSFHVGDRFFAENFPAGRRRRFLDWLQARQYNTLSIASHYLNRNSAGRGAGWRTPALWDEAGRTVRPAAYRRTEAILDDLARRRLIVYPFAGFVGRDADFPSRRKDRDVYVQYTLARFSSYWNILLNVAGPEPLWKPAGYRGLMTWDEIERLGRLIKRADPYDHLLSVHNMSGDDLFRFRPWVDYITLQGGVAEKRADYPSLASYVRRNRLPGGKPVFAQEVLWPGNYLHAEWSPGQLRRKALTLLFSGANINFGDMRGDSSSGFSGSLDVRVRHERWHRTFHQACDWLERIAFHRLQPREGLAPRGVPCLSDGMGRHWLYVAESPTLRLGTSSVRLRWLPTWFDPTRPALEREGPLVRSGTLLRTPAAGRDWILRLDESRN